MSLEEIINDYLNKFANSLNRELCFFESQLSLTETIIRAAMAELSSGKRSSHQPYYRFFDKDMEKVKFNLLERKEQIHTCKDFAELHKIVGKEIGHVYRNAVLYVYDTAWKVGAKLDLEPEAVYLHAGTLKGAKALGLNVKRDFIELRELPVPLQRLRPIHIENFLCIYKDHLGNGFTKKNLSIRGC